MSTIDEQLDRFQENEPRLDAIVNGSENTDVVLSTGEAVPSWRKLLARLLYSPPVTWIQALKSAGLSLNAKGDPGGYAGAVGTFEQAKTMNFAAGIDRITTSGRAINGDGGSASYDRWSSPMTSLPAAGRDVYWFEAADSSRWQIAASPEHMAAAFGCLGGAGINAAPLLQAAYLSDNVRVINLGPRRHLIGAPASQTAIIDVPSGKSLVGDNAATSWLEVIPLATNDNQAGPRNAVRFNNAKGGYAADFSIDCKRSGDGRLNAEGKPDDLQRTHGLCFVAQGNGNILENVFAENVNVYNVRGYAHYTVATNNGAKVRNVRRVNCQAINFNIAFETTGDVDHSYGAYNFGNAVSLDGGRLLECEAVFHQYGPIRHREVNAIARGTAAAAILVLVADNTDVISVQYDVPDIDVTAGTSDQAVSCLGNGTNRILDLKITGGRIVSSTGGGLFRFGNFQVRGTEIVAKNGNGISFGGDAATKLDVYAAQIEAYRPTGGTTAALGLVRGDGAQGRWFGSGRIQAVGPASSQAVQDGAITFIGGPPLLVPGNGVAPPITKKFRVHRSEAAWKKDAGNTYQYVELDMTVFRPSGVSGQALAFPKYTVEPGFGVVPATLKMWHVFTSNTTLRVYLDTTNDTTGWVIKAEVTDYPL